VTSSLGLPGRSSLKGLLHGTPRLRGSRFMRSLERCGVASMAGQVRAHRISLLAFLMHMYSLRA
jgi:hypothetical protein